MTPRLTVLSGTRSGTTRPVGDARLLLGRDADCDLRFDPAADAEVSARHAEVRVENGVAFVRDANSTNGTYVNGERLRGERRLEDGDVIRLGARGPSIRYDVTGAGGSTTQRIANAVRRETRGLRMAAGVAALLLIAVGAGAIWSARRARLAHDAELAATRRAADSTAGALRARHDSMTAALHAQLDATTSRMNGLDSALARVRRVDYAAIAAANGRAVVMIAVEMPDGRTWSGSGFAVTPEGAIVTNRHLVRGDDGAAAARIAVLFADTRAWLPARIEKVAGDADLALLRLESDGPFPTVRRVAADPPRIGAPVAVIGYPLGVSAPMEGSGTAVIARTTLGAGTVAKVIPSALQIDAIAMEGSSGSPVFSADGAVVGVVYGGAGAASARIVYAVPGSAVTALLR